MRCPQENYSKWRRWTIFTIGLLENMLFGGVIYGWAQLTHLMKSEGVYFDSCPTNYSQANDSFSVVEDENALKMLYFKGCDTQDRIFAFIFTVACFCNTLPAGPFGYLIYRYGLALNRLLATFLNVLGFLLIGLTNKDRPSWLFVAVILLALGNMLMRISSLQFVNLINKNRSTAMAAISGAYTASAGIFLIVQIAVKGGFTRSHVCWFLAGLASLSAPATLIMPWSSIQDKSLQKDGWNGQSKTPFSDSIFSLSGCLQLYWMSVGFGTTSLFSTKFNAWISDISKSEQEASRYSSVFSLLQFLCPLASLLPGILTDFISARRSNSVELNDHGMKRIKDIRSCIPSLFAVTLLQIFLQICTFFKEGALVYFSLVLLTILRASISPVTSDFIRLRFPPDHFIRMAGMAEAGIVIMLSLQYPVFLWSQEQFLQANFSFILLQLVALLHPLHLLSTKYLIKISKMNSNSPAETCGSKLLR